MQEFENLKRLVQEAEDDVNKAIGGNKAAGTRVRKKMQEIKAGTAVKVDMPADTTKGSLALLENRGRPADAASGVAEAAALRSQAAAQPAG